MESEFESPPSFESNAIMVLGLFIAVLATVGLIYTDTLTEFMPTWLAITCVVGGDLISLVLAMWGLHKASEDQWLTTPRWHLAAFFVVWSLQPAVMFYTEMTEPEEETRTPSYLQFEEGTLGNPDGMEGKLGRYLNALELEDVDAGAANAEDSGVGGEGSGD